MIDYEQYIRSPEWKAKREQRLAIDGYKCAICKTPLNVQVHHLTYERLGNENVETDLRTLCQVCHTRLHESENGDNGLKYTPDHWQYYDKEKTKEFLSMYKYRDIVADGGDINLCYLKNIAEEIEKVYGRNGNSIVSRWDVQYYFANRRISMLWTASHKNDGFVPQGFIDAHWPVKGSYERSTASKWIHSKEGNIEKMKVLYNRNRFVTDIMGEIPPWEAQYGT